MPRVKMARHKDSKLRTIIYGAARNGKKSVGDIADYLGMCERTLQRRMANPEDFTLRELRLTCRYLDIPVDEMRAAILRADN